MSEPVRPNVLQYILYSYGRRLPASMNDWVRNDLVGKWAAWRIVIRVSIPCVLLLLPMALWPTTLYLRASMTLPIMIPFVYFAIALNKVYRRHRLAQHGLNPDLIDQWEREQNADERRAYEQRYRGGQQ